MPLEDAYTEALQLAKFKEMLGNNATEYIREFKRMADYHNEHLDEAIKQDNEFDIRYHQAQYNVYVEFMNTFSQLLKDL